MEHHLPSLGSKHRGVRFSRIVFISTLMFPLKHASTYKIEAHIQTSSICSTAFEPALPFIMDDFGSHSSSLSAFTISIYLVGYCFGPLLVAPVCELYGRVVALYPGFVVYIAALAICGSSHSVAVFIVFRALMGFAGIVFLICGRAVIADIVAPKRRGLAVTFMTSGVTFVSGPDGL
jgi:MFS family permease